jgi:hypothetical protein
MNERRRIEEKLRKKEHEIISLEAQIKEARIYIQALQDVLRLIPKDKDQNSSPEFILRSGSTVAKAREAILSHGNPLHVTEILRALGAEITRESRAALAGSISAYVRKRQIFTRNGPNTFGLIEMGHTRAGQPEPPEDFGDFASAAPSTPSRPDLDDEIKF